MKICTHCYEPTETLTAGDEMWEYCPNCHLMEGETEDIEEEEYDELKLAWSVD